MGEGVSTCGWNSLQQGLQCGPREARRVPGAAPEPGPAPDCAEAWRGPLQTACRSPRTGQTAGPGNGSAPAQQGPGQGLSPLPSPRLRTHIWPPADDSLGAPLSGGAGQGLWIQLLFPLQHPEDCALEEQGGRVSAPARLLSAGPAETPRAQAAPPLNLAEGPHSSFRPPSLLPPPGSASHLPVSRTASLTQGAPLTRSRADRLFPVP